MPVPQRVSFFVVVGSHLEQAPKPVPQRVSFIVVVGSHLEQAPKPVPQRVSFIVGRVLRPVPEKQIENGVICQV